jgi:hypothetical protein
LGGDENTELQEEWVVNPILTWLAVYDGEEFLGVFLVHGCGIVEMHTCLLPNAWGIRALLSAKALGLYLFTQTDAEIVISRVADDNKLAQRYATRGGLVYTHTNEDTKEHFYEINKKEWMCQHFPSLQQ